MRKAIVRYETDEQLDDLIDFCRKIKAKIEYSDKPVGRPVSKSDKIRKWIKFRLKDRVLVSEMERDAKERGFTWSTVRKVLREFDTVRSLKNKHEGAAWQLTKYTPYYKEGEGRGMQMLARGVTY